MNWLLLLLIGYGIIALAVAGYIFRDCAKSGDVYGVSAFAFVVVMSLLMGIAWPVGLLEMLFSSARMGGGR
jgi:hypothetical protein